MPKSAEELFAAALELTNPSDRAALLDRECARNPALRAEVESLLAAHVQAHQFLEHPAAAVAADTLAATTGMVPLTEKPGDKIGRYKLLQKIGEGGCGVVYMAEQEEPIRRRVALKVIKLGMDTRQVIARFEAERQALALMDHPNIAKVHDGGATETGRPYFVMELVRGIKITDYCDQNNLSTRERLGLFAQVCQAIQHAHQKGIIHRDIKPSNILVTLHDGVPVPKVIDFGIAKATEGRLTDKTLFTEFQQFIGTPAYMSPEQAEMSGLDIDTRTDIYALGVLLYELLIGKTPFDASELLKAGLDEMRRIIREKEPLRPSTRLTALTNEELTKVAHQRQSAPPKLISLVRGDLDWIVMKCLEKDRTRRYETTNGMAMDIHRHLNNEPVAARPPSNLYRFEKLVRRNKLAFGAAVAVATSLTLGVVVSTCQSTRAIRARATAEQATQAANNAQRSSTEQLVHLNVANGWQSDDAGDRFDALLWFTEALRLSQDNPASEELQNITLPLKQEAAVFHASFHPDGSGLIVAASEQVRFIRLAKEERPIQDLTLIAQLLSAHRLQPGLGLRPAESSDLEAAWQKLREKYPDEFTSAPGSDFSWHEGEAVVRERDREWFAALVHLEKMTAARPDDARLRERRDKARAERQRQEAWEEVSRERRRESRRLAGVKIDPTRIPATTVSGKVEGKNFVCAKATVDGRGLFLEPAQNSIALRVILNLERAETLSGRTFTASVSAAPDSPLPSRQVREIVVYSYLVPETLRYGTGFAIYLEFGQIADGQVTGRIDLRLADAQGSSIAGVFTAKVQ